LAGQPELSPAQREVVKEFKGAIRRTVDKMMRYFDFNQR
jgi:hypothetical protein